MLADEPLIAMAEAATIARVSTEAVGRWIVRGKGGRQLEGVRLGKALFTSRAALIRFGQVARAEAKPAGVDPRRVAAAMARLRGLGV